jgi:hypothetical protein
LLHQVILFSQYLIHCFSPQGNFHHWRPLLLHFDTYFKTYLSCRNDLTLLDNLEVDSPLPKHDILQILRVMQIILENCPNKSTFDGIEVSWTYIYIYIYIYIFYFFYFFTRKVGQELFLCKSGLDF